MDANSNKKIIRKLKTALPGVTSLCNSGVTSLCNSGVTSLCDYGLRFGHEWSSYFQAFATLSWETL